MIELDIAAGTSNGHMPAEADALTPAFFASFRRTGARTPERLLMLAVLENAVMCYRRYARARDSQARRWFEEARDWLASCDRSSLFSFESICDALDLHPNYVRRNLCSRPPSRTARMATRYPAGMAPSGTGTRQVSRSALRRAGRADRRRRATLRNPSASKGQRPLPRSLRGSQADGRRGR